MELGKGQRIPINENFLTIKFERPISALEIDVAAFLTQSNGKVAADEDFVFYGNANHHSEGVILNSDGSIDINLDKIPRHVEKISLTATIYDADKRRQNFSMIRDARLRIFGTRGEIATFPLENFTVETAIVLGEVYRYRGNWKFNATGAGFSGGLAALCNDFGIEVKDVAPPPIEPPKPKINTQREKTSARRKKITIPPPPTDNFPQKIELRRGQKVNLIKKGSQLGEIVINLSCSQPQQRIDFSGGFRGKNIYFACLFELKDGTIGAIQALGNYFGEMNYPPYISLDSNGRTGEIIRVNGKFIDKICRILIYTFIYSGAANWEEAKGVVTVNCPGSPELIVKMDEYGSKKHTCAIALLENVGETFSVERIVEFFDDSEQMDRAFDWGLRWTVGSKD